jgi:hypothetical protein
VPSRVKPAGKMKSLADAKRSKGVLIPELQAVALKTSGPDPDRRTDVLHASEMAKADWCPRATYYRITGRPVPAESFSFVLESIFDEGNEIHRKWQTRMRQTGKLYGSWKCLICKVLHPDGWEPSPMEGRCLVGGVQHIWEYAEVHLWDRELQIIGHEDGAMMNRNPLDSTWHEPFMVEIKSVGSGTIRFDAPEMLKRYYVETTDGKMLYDFDSLWKDLSRPFTSHVRQANIYLELAERMGLPFKSVRFLYEFKFNQQVKEFVITKSDDILEPLLTKAAEVRYALKNRKPPPCPTGGCKYCEAYEKTEESNAGATKAGAGPVSPGRVQRRSPVVSDAGDRPRSVGTTARRRVTGSTPGPDGGPGPAADESLPGHRPVGPVSRTPAGGSGGRRVVRRKRADTD